MDSAIQITSVHTVQVVFFCPLVCCNNNRYWNFEYLADYVHIQPQLKRRNFTVETKWRLHTYNDGQMFSVSAIS